MGQQGKWDYSKWMLDRHLPGGPIAQQPQFCLQTRNLIINTNFQSLSRPETVVCPSMLWSIYLQTAGRWHRMHFWYTSLYHHKWCDHHIYIFYWELHTFLVRLPTANHSHWQWHHCWHEGHLNLYQINLRGGSISSLEWTAIGIKVYRQEVRALISISCVDQWLFRPKHTWNEDEGGEISIIYVGSQSTIKWLKHIEEH